MWMTSFPGFSCQSEDAMAMRRVAQRREIGGWEGCDRHYIYCGAGARNVSPPLVFKVPRQCPLVPLVEASSTESEALGSKKVYGYEDHQISYLNFQSVPPRKYTPTP
jgi:hypothetical protein